MAVSIGTQAGSATISVDGGNPALILLPTGEVRVGVDSAIISAAPTQLCSAQSVIDYVQQNSMTSLTVGGPTTLGGYYNYYTIPIPAYAKKITVSFLLAFGNTTANSKAIWVGLGTDSITGCSGTGTVTGVGASAATAKWASVNASAFGAAITNNTPTTASNLNGVAVFTYMTNSIWAFESQVGYSNAAQTFISTGRVTRDPEDGPVLYIRSTYAGADMAFYGNVTAFAE